MAQVVSRHADLIAVRREGGLLGCREVHRCVADQHVQPPAAVAEVLHKMAESALIVDFADHQTHVKGACWLSAGCP